MKNLKYQYNFEDLDDEDIEEAYWEELDKRQGDHNPNSRVSVKTKSPRKIERDDEFRD
jgi:hypothetical protein